MSQFEDLHENDTYIHLEVFKDHWKQILNVFNKSLINDDDIEIFKNNFDQMFILLINELNEIKQRSEPTDALKLGRILTYLLQENIFEVTFLWSISYPEYLYELKYLQLKYYEILLSNMMFEATMSPVSQMQTPFESGVTSEYDVHKSNQLINLLFYRQLNRPLFSLLNHCSKHKSKYIEKHMISVLNQLCVCICKNVQLLNIFFDLNEQQKLTKSHSGSSTSSFQQQSEQGPARFLIFSLLIPYIHQEGYCGQQARDALLMIMQLSARNQDLAKHIVENTDFCPVLATGLSALYSELPQKLTQSSDDMYIITKDDIYNNSSLCQFINSLEFCNNVIQVSHALIANQLLQYVYHGFLIPVIAPALNQDCIDEVIAATAYLELFLRTITEEKFLNLFLKFVLYTRIDELTLLETLINRINTNTNKLSFVTLNLFYTLLDLNSEDVLYKLVLSYLLPCKHVMKSQINSLKETLNPSAKNSEYLLSLSTSYASQCTNILNSMSRSNSLTDTNNNNNSLAQLVNRNSPPKKQQPVITTSFTNSSRAQPQTVVTQPPGQVAAIKLTDSMQVATQWLKRLYENKSNLQILTYFENMKFNFTDYLNDAKNGVESCKLSCSTNKWTLNMFDIYSQQLEASSKHQLGVDADEYMLNLFTNAFNDEDDHKKKNEALNKIESSKNTDLDASTITTAPASRTVTSDNLDDIEIYLDKFAEMYFMDDNLLENNTESTRKAKKYTYVKSKRVKQQDFYVLSFDNAISSSSSEPEDGSSGDDDDDAEETKIKENAKPTKISFGFDEIKEENGEIEGDANEFYAKNRNIIISHFFANQETIDSYLNSNLNSFLSSLDTLNLIDYEKPSDPLDVICGEIMKFYSNLSNPSSLDSGKLISFNEALNEIEAEKRDESLNNNENLKLVSFKSLISEQHIPDFLTNGNNGAAADTGPFLKAIFSRLEQMLTNSLHINFLITGLIARLCYYAQPILRSFLLDHNLVLESNVKSLIQVLATVKSKIDSCSQTYNNFTLLYLQAELKLIKRLTITSEQNTAPEVNEPIEAKTQKPVSITPNSKKSLGDKILGLFRRPSVPNGRNVDTNEEGFPQIQLLSDLKMKFINVNTPVTSMVNGNAHAKARFGNEAIQLKDINNYTNLISEWDDLKTRNIAYAAVIYDEFLKELASICQEHCIQQC